MVLGTEVPIGGLTRMGSILSAGQATGRCETKATTAEKNVYGALGSKLGISALDVRGYGIVVKFSKYPSFFCCKFPGFDVVGGLAGAGRICGHQRAQRLFCAFRYSTQEVMEAL